MAHQQSQTAQTPKPTMLEQLLRIQSILATSRFACLHLNNQSDSDFYSIGETIALAEMMIGECADVLEEKGGGK